MKVSYFVANKYDICEGKRLGRRLNGKPLNLLIIKNLWGMEPKGFEPSTSCMPCKRSPN